MKNKVLKVAIVFIHMLVNTNSYSQHFQKEIPFKYEFKSEISTNKQLDSVKLYLVIDTVQKKSKNGLVFKLRFINNTHSDIKIYNPLDFSHLTLNDSSGTNIAISRVSKYKINTNGSNEPFAYEAFNVTDVFIKNVRKSVSLPNEKQIILPKNGKYEIGLSITDCVRKNKENGHKIINKIDLGNYKIIYNITYINDERQPGVTLQIDPTTIHYGNVSY